MDASLEKLKILVADDSKVYRRLVETTLADAQYTLVFAKNGHEALGLSERASGSVTISHRGDAENPVKVEISQDPAEVVQSNIELLPGDTVFAAKAPMVYVLGEVNKPGGYILNSANAMTVLRVVAAAGGPTHAASVGGTKLVRRTPSGLRELPVPLKAILRGKTADMPLSADDILFVPSSRLKTAVAMTTVVATSAATAAVYHVY